MSAHKEFAALLRAERESVAALTPYVTLAFEERVHADGHFRVGLLRPDGSVLHSARLERENSTSDLKLRVKYDIPTVGPCEVHIVVRPLAPEPEPDGVPLDDYGFNDYYPPRTSSSK